MAAVRLTDLAHDHVVSALRDLGLTSRSTLLEVGCGPGQYRQPTPCRYVGLDISAADYWPGTPRTPDVVGDAEGLPIASGSIDAVLFVAALHISPQPRRALAEAERVLKPGGRLLVFDYTRKTHRQLERGRPLPRWTQWQLAATIRSVGFATAHIAWPPSRFREQHRWLQQRWLKPAWLLANELRGGWATVIATKT